MQVDNYSANPTSRDAMMDVDRTQWQPTEPTIQFNNVASKASNAEKAFELFYQSYLERFATLKDRHQAKARLIEVINGLLRDPTYQFTGDIVEKIFKLLADFGLDVSETWTKILDEGLANAQLSNFESLKVFCNMAEDHLTKCNIRLLPCTAFKLLAITTRPNPMIESINRNNIAQPPHSPTVPCSPLPKPESSLFACSRSGQPLFPSPIQSPASRWNTQIFGCLPVPIPHPAMPSISSPHLNQYSRGPVEVQSPTHSVSSGPLFPTNAWRFHVLKSGIIPIRTYKRPDGYQTPEADLKSFPIPIPREQLITPLNDPRIIYTIVQPKPKKIVKTVKKKALASNKSVVSLETGPGLKTQSKVQMKPSDKSGVKLMKAKTASGIKAISREKKPTKTPIQAKLAKPRMKRQFMTNCQLKPSGKNKTPLKASSSNQQLVEIEKKISNSEMKSKNPADEQLFLNKEEATTASSAFLGRLKINHKAKNNDEDEPLLRTPRVPSFDFKDLCKITRTIKVS